MPENQNIVIGDVISGVNPMTSNTRYVMLTIYSLSNFMQSFQWLQYTIISNIITKYYNVTIDEVNFTSIVYFLAILFLTIPCNWLLKRIGMRNHVIIGAFLNCLGTLIKCLSNSPSLFYVTLAGQTLGAIASAFVEPLPAQIARIWFPTKEASRATSVGLLSLFAGNLLATSIPVVLVPNSDVRSEIATGLNYLFIGQAIVATAIFFWTIFSFQEKPERPPSKSEALVAELRKEQNYCGYLKSVLSINMILLMIVCGICAAANQSLLTVLNEFLLSSFDDDESLVGITGFLFSFANIVSTFFFGYLLDKKHWYKSSIYVTYGLSALLFFIIYVTLKMKNVALLLTALTALGFTIGSWSSICINYAAELTYPLPESISSGVLMMSSELLSTIMTIIVSTLIINSSKLVTTSFYSISMLVAIAFTFFLRNDLRRKMNESETQALLNGCSKKSYTNRVITVF